MKKFLYPLFAVLTSVCLVLGGFSFSAQQGRFCAFEVQRAEAAVPLTAPYIFGALLGCFGVSVAGYAGANGLDVETALNNAWDSFQAFAAADVVQAFRESFALFTSPVMPVSALNISSMMYQTVADWLLQSDYLVSSPVSYPNVSVQSGTKTFDIPVTPDSDFLVSTTKPYAPLFTCYDPSFQYATCSSPVSIVSLSVVSGGLLITIDKQYISYYRGTNGEYLGGSNAGTGNYNSFSYNPAISTGGSHAVSVSSSLATLLNSSYLPSGGSVSVSSSNAVVDVPESVSSAISSGSAEAYGQAVEDAVSGQNINIDSATVENPAWTDVFGEIASTLESIQAAIESGFAGVLEGVQTFFRPVVEFFAPLDIRDSDDIGELVISNVSKEHTFTTKFPFCLVNDYKLLYEKAISPAGGSSDYPTPGMFGLRKSVAQRKSCRLS